MQSRKEIIEQLNECLDQAYVEGVNHLAYIHAMMVVQTELLLDIRDLLVASADAGAEETKS